MWKAIYSQKNWPRAIYGQKPVLWLYMAKTQAYGYIYGQKPVLWLEMAKTRPTAIFGPNPVLWLYMAKNTGKRLYMAKN